MTASIIRVDFERLADITQRFQNQQENLAQMLQYLETNLQPLESGSWQGEGAQAFVAEMNENLLPAVARLAKAMEQASLTVNTISTLFAMAEEEAAAHFQINTKDSTTTSGDTPLSVNSGSAEWFYQTNKLFLDIVQEMVKDRGATKEALRQFGRFLNTLTGQRGHVGFMNDMYDFFVVESIPWRGSIDKLLRSKWFEGGLVGTDALFGFFNDLNNGTYGENYLKAGGVNVIDALIQFAISKNPYGAAALIVSGAVQIVGDLQVGMQRTVADLFAVDAEMEALLHHDADNVAVAVDKMDLTNVTKEISELVYEPFVRRTETAIALSSVVAQSADNLVQDPSYRTLSEAASSFKNILDGHGTDIFYMMSPSLMFMPSGNDWQNLLDVGRASINIVDGMLDWAISSSSSGINLGVNSFTHFANVLPSDSLRQSVNEATKDAVTFIQEQADWVIHFIDL